MLGQRRHVPGEALDLAQGRNHASALQQHRRGAVDEAVFVADSQDLGLGGDHLVHQAEIDEELDGLARLGVSIVSRCRVIEVVDQLAAGLPDERGEADEAVLHSQAMLISETIAVDILCQRLCGGEKIVPGPARFRVGHARGVKEIAVVVDDQTGEVLRQAHQLLTESECLEWLGEVVPFGNDLARRQQRSDRGQQPRCYSNT